MNHIKEMNDELARIDKLAEVFNYFGYRQRYGWSFEQYVGYVDRGILQEMLGNA